jgi:hypothetical protein
MTRGWCSHVAVGFAVSGLLTACGSDASWGPERGGESAGGESSGGSSAAGSSAASGGTGIASGGKASGGQHAGGGTAGQAAGGVPAAGGAAVEGCNMPPGTAPEMKWVNATGNLAKMASECGNLGLVSAQPCSNRVIAGVAQKGLWETVDGGKTWAPMGQGAGSDKITNRISAIVYDPKDPKTFWESGIYNGGGVYKTTDSGETFKQLGDVTHCDSVSVDFSDPGRMTLLAGGHETNTKLNLSTDGGMTWKNVAAGLPNGYCTATLVLGAADLLVACASSIVHGDTGAKWDPVPGSTGGVFQPLLAKDGTIYWPVNNGGVSKSEDGGKSFASVATADEAPGILAPAQFAELPDGRVVINGKDHLLASADKGKTWLPIGEALPFPGGGFEGAHGVAYSAQTKTFFIWRWDCMNVVPDNAIMSMGFDWETN